jgi:hypothetical protein
LLFSGVRNAGGYLDRRRQEWFGYPLAVAAELVSLFPLPVANPGSATDSDGRK